MCMWIIQDKLRKRPREGGDKLKHDKNSKIIEVEVMYLEFKMGVHIGLIGARNQDRKFSLLSVCGWPTDFHCSHLS